MQDKHHAEPVLPTEVYRRTAQGQRELVSPTTAYSDGERQLLGMLTGFTAMQALLSLVPSLSAPDQIIERLLEAGLVERAPVQTRVPA